MLLCIPGNVPKILKHLEQRFGRGDLVIQRLITKAKDCRAVRLDDMESLLDFHAAEESLTACMKLLKHTGHLYKPQLRCELVGKLPAALRLQWGEAVANVPGDNITLEDFAV